MCLALAGYLSPLAAQVKEDRRVTAHRIENGIVVDGELDEAEWQLVEPATGFVQQDPRTGEPSTETTEVCLLYDQENLYVGVYCFDSAGGEAIIVNDMRRDFVAFSNDTFIVVLDTFNDNRNAFFFSVNPSGAKFDMQASDNGRKRNRDWDGIWHSQAKITESGSFLTSNGSHFLAQGLVEEIDGPGTGLAIHQATAQTNVASATWPL